MVTLGLCMCGYFPCNVHCLFIHFIPGPVILMPLGADGLSVLLGGLEG